MYGADKSVTASCSERSFYRITGVDKIYMSIVKNLVNSVIRLTSNTFDERPATRKHLTAQIHNSLGTVETVRNIVPQIIQRHVGHRTKV